LIAQVDIPVNPHTGQIEISLPLWELQVGSARVPISLNHSGGGVKVTDTEGNAGMGWNVSAGGQIVREVKGLPDDGANGWLSSDIAQQVQNFSPTAAASVTTCANELNDYNAISALAAKDTEPDIFTVSVPGIHAKFIFDQTGTIRFIPYQDLKINYSRDAYNNIVAFTLTSNKGVKCQFDLPLKKTKTALNGPVWIFNHDYTRFQNGISYNYSWLVSRICDVTNVCINFIYDENRDVTLYKKFRVVSSSEVQELFTMREVTQVSAIQRVSSPDHWLQFVWGKYGVLESVSVSNSKTFKFKYDRIRNVNDEPITTVTAKSEPVYTNVGTDGFEYERPDSHYRSFLVEFSEGGDNCISFPAYRFSYYDVNLQAKTTSIPFKNQFARDFWGYYNGAPDDITSLSPKLYIKATATGYKSIRFSPHPNDVGYVATSGTDRSTNSTTVFFGSLKNITYPSGGIGEITYEAADYYDSLITQTLVGGGIRVKKVRISDGDSDNTNDIITEYEYKRANGHSSGTFTYPPTFAIHTTVGLIRLVDNLSADDELIYSRATVKQSGKGRIVYEYAVPVAWQQTQVRDWRAPLSRLARHEYDDYNDNGDYIGKACPYPANVVNDYYGYPYGPSTDYSFERGLPSVISTYNEADNLLAQKSFSYARLTTSPVHVKALAIDLKLYQYTLYSHVANVAKVIVTETTRTFEVPGSSLVETREYNYSPIHFLLESVRSTSSANKITKTRFKYARDFSSITTSVTPAGAAIVSLNATNRHATLLEIIQSTIDSKGERVTGSQLTTFNMYPGFSTALPAQQLIFNGTSNFVESNFNSSNVYNHTGYRVVNSIEAYTSFGFPLMIKDQQLNLTSIIYNESTSFPRAIIKNARWDEVVVNAFNVEGPSSEIGNELFSGFEILTQPFSGEFPLKIHGGSKARSSGVKRNASNRFYRFACRVRSTSSSSINVNVRDKNTNVKQAGGVITYLNSDINKWKYLEVLIDMNAVSNTFVIELDLPTTIDFDYAVFYPAKAELTTQVVHPVFGITSQTNTHGITTFREYDAAGRLRHVKDQDKNLVLIKEYQYKAKPSSIKAAFYGSDFIVGRPLMLQAVDNCIPGVAYQWYVNNVPIQSGYLSTFTYTFQDNFPEVKLEVSHPEYGSDSHIQKLKAIYDYQPNPLPPGCIATLQITGDLSPMHKCENGEFPSRAFAAQFSAGTNCNGYGVSWQYRLIGPDAMNSFIPYPEGAGANIIFKFSGTTNNYPWTIGRPQSFQVRAVFKAGDYIAAVSNVLTVEYVDESYCP